MMDKKVNVGDLLKDIPNALGSIHQEVTSVGKSLLNSSLQKSEIVTRQEFETQKEILQEVLKKLDVLEALIESKENNNQI